ncbi:UDP-N-acetylmuramoyl-L-alanyl-D-glutamate synthetase [Neosynechococcus sphagnicola sy1]|uniref:UDP-N-acetylmuramoylalanine--D-glutamate ligase n=1 Tax=Neosynechococcus sphagnicola sy1 TaxID=1497020 RepID=A0A098TJX8_9CYAN|nr:UDP-N-acetylmuramoyl-L-alanine--D-glutamate ligase [Neosynechococcus sphagnicola]KGF72147.1 UDP-N-acetylmuramoyl-L-alanyl-D-glutamate synthetase [Neosynechococcus sphagnicola sy1]
MPTALVIGLGKSGIAAARLLQQQGWQVIVSDRQISPALLNQQQQLAREGIPVWLGHAFDLEATDTPSNLDLVVVSPGVPWDLPKLQAARDRGIAMVGEIELAWRTLGQSPWVGVTGTNGKTTTTALIAAIFAQAGLQAPACGNIGFAACELATAALTAAQPPDWVIAEISSYQIESSSTVAPRIGVWTTFTPDHLSRHYTLENYFRIKASLLQASEQRVLNADDPFLNQHCVAGWSDICWTSTQGKSHLPADPNLGVYLEDGWVIAQGEPIVQATQLRMLGQHNLQNLLMAVAVARLAGIESAAIAAAVATFPGVAHRLEHIGTWQGVTFINDSKATNYDAAQVGLAAVKAPAILIAGGEAKAGDDQGWIATIQAQAAHVLLIGSAAPAFAQRLDQAGYHAYDIVETMERAIPRAATLAQQVKAAVVLLSPACASFDQYPNFETRGDHFRRICQEHFS